MKKIKWGIIGLGNIAHKFAEDLLEIDGAQLYAVASRSQEKADEFASNYKVKKAYSSYKDLVLDSNVDAVYIATPHALHKENTLLCLEHKVPVLCEKPFAMNADEVNEMISAAKTHNTLLMEALWTYFLPHYQYVLQLIKDKTYGNLLKLEADFGFYREFDNSSRLFNKPLGGGSLLDIGIYPIFAALSTLGKPIGIEAEATFFENGADSSCSMIFNYENNIKAYLKSSLLEVLPTEAFLVFENASIKINRQFHCPTTVTINSEGRLETLDFGYSSIGYRYEIVHFNDLIRNGKKESPIMTYDFSKLIINTLDQVRHTINLRY